MSKFFDFAISQVSDDVKRFVDNSFEVANQIHDILERQGKTQRDLASMLGKSESEISKWLSGTHNFTVKSISKMESVLNEKIVTTPLQFRHDFLKMAANAISFLDVHSTAFFPVVDSRFNREAVFVEVSRMEKKSDEIHIEHSSYSLVA